jgi:hypothetical protein
VRGVQERAAKEMNGVTLDNVDGRKVCGVFASFGAGEVINV